MPDFLVPVSESFRAAVKAAGVQGHSQRKIAKAAGVRPAFLNEILSGRLLVDVGDARVERIAALLEVEHPFDMSRVEARHV